MGTHMKSFVILKLWSWSGSQLRLLLKVLSVVRGRLNSEVVELAGFYP